MRQSQYVPPYDHKRPWPHSSLHHIHILPWCVIHMFMAVIQSLTFWHIIRLLASHQHFFMDVDLCKRFATQMEMSWCQGSFNVMSYIPS